jgi:hypothetical protein
MSTISELVVKIGADSSGLSSSLNQAKTDINKTFDINPINNMNNAINGLNNSVTGLIGKFNGLVGLAAGGFGLNALVEGAVNAGAGVYQMAQTLHASTAEAAEFNRILKLTGAETHLAETAFVRLDKTFTSSGESGDKCRAIFQAVGVSLTDGNGKLKPINEQLESLAQGYKKAADAGYGQEFIMNTLGARGMDLVKTLKNYNEAKENSEKVKGIGLDPAEMYKVQQEMKLTEMQAGQLKIAMGSIFVDIFKGSNGEINNTLAEMASWIAKNRSEIAGTTVEILKLLAAYEAVKVVKNVAGGISNIIGKAGTKSTMDAVNNAQETALTAQQEKSIVKRQALIENAAKKEEAAYYKTVQAMEASEAEKTQIFTDYLLKREQASMEEQASIRASMTEMYLEANAKAEESAVAQSESFNAVASAAEESAARVAEANASAAASADTVVESNELVVASEEEKLVAAEESGAAEVEAATEATAATDLQTVSTETQTEATITQGSEAEIAGEKGVIAANDTTAATELETTATETQTTATITAGNEATLTGGKAVTACAEATTATKIWTSAVMLLRSSWLLVAYATYEAVRAMISYNKAQAEKLTSNDGVDYTVGDTHYVLKNGDFYEAEYTTETRTDKQGFEHDYTYKSGLSSEAVDRSSDTFDALNTQYNDAHQNDEDVQALYEKQAADKRMKEQNDKLKELMASFQPNVGNGGGHGGSGAGASAPAAQKPVEVDVPIGEVAVEYAKAQNGNDWKDYSYGNNDGAGWCDSFMAAMYKAAGIGNIGGISTASSTINDAAFKAANAYHPAGDGYQPQNGDLVDFPKHVGMYYNGNVISRQSGGVKIATLEQANDWFGGIQGYGSVAEATGGLTVKQTVDKDGKVMEDAAKKLAKAKEDASKLFSTMANTILDEDETEYQSGMRKVNNDVRSKQLEINKYKTAGVDVTALEKELDLYKKTLDKKVVEKWHEAWFKIKDDTRQALDAITYNYEDAANTQYATQQRALEKEKKERLKDIQQSNKDKVAKLAVEKWYNTELLKLQDERNKAVRESHDKYIKSLAEDGNYLKIITDLKYHPDRRQNDMNIKAQKDIASEYIKIWDAAHTTIAANISSVTDTLYGSLTDSINGFISGTKGAMSIVHDFGNTIIKEMERIAAQQLAGQILSTMMGSWFTAPTKGMNHSLTQSTYQKFMPSTDFLNTSKSATSGSNNYKFKVKAFATGGIVTAPTLGLIGETGTREAVVPLTDSNLKAMGGKSSGGVVVNITNNSDSKPRVASSRYDEGLNKTVLDIVIDGASRNVGGFSTNLKTALK